MMQKGYNQYDNYKQQQKQSIESASRVQLIGMLLEGAIRYNKKALLALEANNNVIALEAVANGSDVVSHLYNCLNFDEGGEVAQNLGNLYHHILLRYSDFIRGRENPDKTILEKINGILATVLEGWRKIEEGQGA